jgi:hypothetical protein
MPLNVSTPENLALLLHGFERVTCRCQHWHDVARRRQIDRRPAYEEREREWLP